MVGQAPPYVFSVICRVKTAASFSLFGRVGGDSWDALKKSPKARHPEESPTRDLRAEVGAA